MCINNGTKDLNIVLTLAETYIVLFDFVKFVLLDFVKFDIILTLAETDTHLRRQTYTSFKPLVHCSNQVPTRLNSSTTVYSTQ